MLTSMSLRLFSAAPRMVSQLPFGVRRRSGTGIRRTPRRYWPVREPLTVGGGPEVHQPAALCAGLGAEVQDEIALADDLGVVLHDHHRVAEVPQALQDANQAVVVARVQPDAGLVQHVERVDEGGAEGRCQGNALDLPARQGARLPVQREVAQAHVPEIREPTADLIQDHASGLVGLRHRQPLEKVEGLVRRSARRPGQW